METLIDDTAARRIVEAIRTDVRRWARFHRIQTFFQKDDILDKIISYREELSTAITGLIVRMGFIPHGLASRDKNTTGAKPTARICSSQEP